MASLLRDEGNLAELEEVHRILNLFHHRNKNQHRRDGWWKWFSMLRRSAGRLVRECRQNKREAQVEIQIKFMIDFLFLRCYQSFTQLVADTQFSVLGLVLLAELSRTQKAIGALNWNARSTLQHGRVIDDKNRKPQMVASEDLGEVLARPYESGNLDCEATDTATMAGELHGEPLKPEEQQVRVRDSAISPSPPMQSSMGPITDVRAETATFKNRATTTAHSKKRQQQQQQQGRSKFIDDLFEGLT